MAEFVTSFDTAEGVKKYDYNALGNKPSTDAGTVVSPNADYAEVAEWADGNPNAEDRTGFFVCLDVPVDGLIMRKATSIDDVKGVTMLAPAFSGNFSADKVDSTGKLLPKYSFVGVMGLVPVIDNGTCTVGGRCMPDDNGCAVPSSNEMGYQVVNRVDVNHVLIIVEPGADMLQRIKTQIVELQENGGGNGVADLAQNDPNGEGYVKNRTHWKEVNGVDIVAFPEATVELTSGNNMVNGFVKNSFIEGNKYKVIWNGTEYECICYVEDGTYLLGNGVYLGLTTEKDYPFCIGSYNGAVGFVGKGTETDETITLKIYSEQETIYHQLDPRYIPNMYYEEDGGTVEILPEMTIPVDPDNPIIPSNYKFDIAAGDILTVKWNGVEYVCTVQDISNDIGMPGVALGDLSSVGLSGGNGEPFCMLYSPEFMEAEGMSGFYGMIAVLDGSTSVTLSVAKDSAKIHKIDNKFLDLKWLPIETEKEIFSFETTIDENNGTTTTGHYVYIECDTSALTSQELYPMTIGGVEVQGTNVVVYINDIPNNMLLLDFGIGYRIIATEDEVTSNSGAFVIWVFGDKIRVNTQIMGDILVRIAVLTPNKLPEKFLPDGFNTDISTSKTNVYLADCDISFILNEKNVIQPTTAFNALRGELSNAIRNKNLRLHEINVLDRSDITNPINYFNNRLTVDFTNYYEISNGSYTAHRTSATVEDDDGNVFNITVSVNNMPDGEITECYLTAKKLS